MKRMSVAPAARDDPSTGYGTSTPYIPRSWTVPTPTRLRLPLLEALLEPEGRGFFAHEAAIDIHLRGTYCWLVLCGFCTSLYIARELKSRRFRTKAITQVNEI